MNTFLRDTVATVLTSTLNELIVLSHGKHLRSKKIPKTEVTKIAQSFQTQVNNNLPVETLNEIKLNNDLKKLIDIYMDILSELQATGTIQILLTTIGQQIEKNNKEKALIQEHKSSTLALKNIRLKLTEFKSETDKKLLETSETLNNLKSDWRIISKINELEYELVQKWESTRFSQATIVCARDEEVLAKKLSTFLAKTEAEERVICDFKAYSKHEFNEYSKLIVMWKEKYSKELDELLQSISEKENKIKEVNKIYEKHYEIDCKRKEFIDGYLAQKAEQNRLLQLQLKRIESAIKIQAWWRGVMVRRCLGPYKKKSKKGKKAKKAK